jgi:hypothetical protein
MCFFLSYFYVLIVVREYHRLLATWPFSKQWHPSHEQ